MDAFVPQISSISIEQITEAFAREVVSHAKVNITAVIRENLPMWETKLFPVISKYEISKYEVVADILVSAGCKTLTNDDEREMFIKSVGNAIRAIKQSNGELTAKQKREASRSIISADKLRPGVRLTEQSTSQPPSIVHSQNNKEGLAPSHQLKTEPVPMAITKPQVVAKPVQVASKQYNLDEFPFLEHTERLQVDVLASYDGKVIEWNALDDELLDVFSQISKNKYTPLEKLNNAFTSIEDIKKNCYAKFKLKCKACGIELKNYGFKN